MTSVNATELAKKLGLTAGRISQLVTEGKLTGCFTGEGRARRFDLKLVAKSLGHQLDPGQLMGNGSGTKAALESISEGSADQSGEAQNPDDRGSAYEIARTQKAREDARTAKRKNDEADGTLVLASAVSVEVRGLMAKELAEFETVVVRDGARKVADKLGIDFKSVRAILREVWRDHRASRAKDLEQLAAGSELSGDEKAADF